MMIYKRSILIGFDLFEWKLTETQDTNEITEWVGEIWHDGELVHNFASHYLLTAKKEIDHFIHSEVSKMDFAVIRGSEAPPPYHPKTDWAGALKRETLREQRGDTSE